MSLAKDFSAYGLSSSSPFLWGPILSFAELEHKDGLSNKDAARLDFLLKLDGLD